MEDPAMTDFRARGTIMGPAGLTAVFGMGTGGAPPVSSPETGRAAVRPRGPVLWVRWVGVTRLGRGEVRWSGSMQGVVRSRRDSHRSDRVAVASRVEDAGGSIAGFAIEFSGLGHRRSSPGGLLARRGRIGVVKRFGC